MIIDVEKLRKGLSCCVPCLSDAGTDKSRCHECPYRSDEDDARNANRVYCILGYVLDALALVQHVEAEGTPGSMRCRVLGLDELLETPVGCGWLECWFPPEPEDGTEEYIEFSPFAWAGEHFVSAQYG